MIRPLIYCENITHINTSVSTIDERILELEKLREAYLKKGLVLDNDKNANFETETNSKVAEESLG